MMDRNYSPTIGEIGVATKDIATIANRPCTIYVTPHNCRKADPLI